MQSSLPTRKASTRNSIGISSHSSMAKRIVAWNSTLPTPTTTSAAHPAWMRQSEARRRASTSPTPPASTYTSEEAAL
jgi:hypothetical protein